jgi:hypothetical protein
MTKPKAGEPPTDDELWIWWEDTHPALGDTPPGRALRGGADILRRLAFARRVWRECRERTLAEVEAALWERVGREEYGHAKAAVTLDIEVVRALAARTEK